MTTTTELKNEIAAAIGVDADRIGQVKIELDVLRRQGLLVDLDISGVGMFARTATYLEMGWGEEDIDARRSKMGRAQKYLIPDEKIKELRSVESRMRQLLDRHSFRITGFSPYRWLPVTAYTTFKDEWASLEYEFRSIRMVIVSNLDNYRDQLADEMREVAHDAWKSIMAVTNYQQYENVVVNHIPYNHTEFIELVMKTALDGFPSLEKIENELTADYRTALVYGEQDVAADHAEAEKIKLDVKMQKIEQQEREMALDAMFTAEAEHAREQLSEIASPFAEVFKALRSQIAKDATEILASIEKNGFVRGKVAERGAGLLDLFDLLAVQNDKELRKQLVDLRDAIGPIGSERGSEIRSTVDVKNVLEQIMDLEKKAVEDLLAGPSRFSLIE